GSASSSKRWCARTSLARISKPPTDRWPGTRHARPKPWNGPKAPSGMSPMKRGEVWWVNFEPAGGGEGRKERPAAIVSNDASNKHWTGVQVVPLSSNVDRLYPSEALVTVRGKKHKAMADQLTTVSKSRLDNRLGSLSKADMQGVEQVIKLQLALP